ncbi:MAG: hypothetical protein AAF363_19630 [Bacteroidota bacterium]
MKQALTLTFVLIINLSCAQNSFISRPYYSEDEFYGLLDSLRVLNNHKIEEAGGLTELASQIALLHYPKLKRHKIKINYKKNVKYPITASWSFWNVFKPRPWHTYVLLIHPDSFVERISLNKRVALIAHEMAHFEYYRKIPSIAMLWWGLKYTLSDKFRYRFEREADFTVVDKGLGQQMLDMSIYTSKWEIKDHIQKANETD